MIFDMDSLPSRMAASLAEPGIALRPERSADQSFIRRLYRAGRADEIAAAGWPPKMARAFLDDQFTYQEHHFAGLGAGLHRFMITSDRQAIGRLYLIQRADFVHIVDIALIAQRRKSGLGTDIVSVLQRAVADHGQAGLTLNVVKGSAAIRLYQRLGFALADTAHPTHLSMIWRSGS